MSKIFDFHLHPGYDFHNDRLGYEITPEIFVEGLKQAGITRCAGSFITKGHFEKTRNDQPEIIPEMNEKCYQFHQKYPELFTPGIHIHPDFAEISVAEIEKYGKKGVKLIGELAPYAMHWSCGYDSAAMHDILSVAGQYNMVFSGHPTSAADMDSFARNNPRTIIVFAHIDGYGLYDAEIEMMRKYDNVYFDISAHGQDRPGMLHQTVDLVGSERILYGTDYPGYTQKTFLDLVRNSSLTEDEIENIFWNNAVRLLGLQA